MIITDRDGLSAVQIARINRIELARYRKSHPTNHTARNHLIAFGVGVAMILCSVALLIHQQWSPGTDRRWMDGTQMYTNLTANLDDQKPSITIYAREK